MRHLHDVKRAAGQKCGDDFTDAASQTYDPTTFKAILAVLLAALAWVSQHYMETMSVIAVTTAAITGTMTLQEKIAQRRAKRRQQATGTSD